jgi:hypothetical protein
VHGADIERPQVGIGDSAHPQSIAQTAALAKSAAIAEPGQGKRPPSENGGSPMGAGGDFFEVQTRDREGTGW